MIMTCPHCGFSKEIDEAQIPSTAARVTCLQCKNTFSFQKGETPEPLPNQVSYPICILEQSEADHCSSCGIGCAKGEGQESANAPSVSASSFATGREQHVSPEALPKAGFWIRVVASLVDSVVVMLIKFVLGFILGMIAASAVGMLNQEGQIMMAAVTWLFGVALAVAYYVFFTGYCGQTPGKMAVRVKVIRTDGTDIGYGMSFLREVIGKFISGIILGIGYLMVVFDSQKQGLHDKIADTYVIKL
jgi:predicted Zn finger-like uncharacterized protein